MVEYIEVERYTGENGVERVRGLAVTRMERPVGQDGAIASTVGIDGEVEGDDTIRTGGGEVVGKVLERDGDTATVEVL